jgi:hypothetical protein
MKCSLHFPKRMAQAKAGLSVVSSLLAAMSTSCQGVQAAPLEFSDFQAETDFLSLVCIIAQIV